MKFTSLSLAVFSLTSTTTYATASKNKNVRGSSAGSSAETGRVDRKLAQEDESSSFSCHNKAAFDHVDEGCNSLFPICALDDGTEPSPHIPGTICAKCVNNVDVHMFADIGCGGQFSQCDAPPGQVGHTCYQPVVSPAQQQQQCINSADYGGLDQGCRPEAPICVDSATGREASAGALGDYCAVCVKVYSEGYYSAGIGDFGCGSSNDGDTMLRCMAVDGADVPALYAGAQCCQADGQCVPPSSGASCPLDVPGGGWERMMDAPHPLSGTYDCVQKSNEKVVLDFGIANEAYAVGCDLNDPVGPSCATYEWNDAIKYYRATRQVVSAAEALSCMSQITDLMRNWGYSGCREQ